MEPRRPRLLGWRIVGSLPDWGQVRLASYVPQFVVLAGAISARSWPDFLRSCASALGLLAFFWLLILAANFFFGPGRRIGRYSR